MIEIKDKKFIKYANYNLIILAPQKYYEYYKNIEYLSILAKEVNEIIRPGSLSFYKLHLNQEYFLKLINYQIEDFVNLPEKSKKTIRDRYNQMEII